MYKFVAVVSARVADGFRLAGVNVQVAESAQNAREILRRLIEDDEVGIIALDERYEEGIDEHLQKKIDSVYRPVLVMLPLREELDVEEYINDHLQSMIRRAVGFDITLKREVEA